jgi:hypothetical protein
MKKKPIEPYIMRQLVAKYGLPEPEIQAMVDEMAHRTKVPASVLLHVQKDIALRWWDAMAQRKGRTS